MSFAARCLGDEAVDSLARQAACAQLLKQVEASGVDQIRLSWCDLHGQLRGKTLTVRALAQALHNGIGMVSTILLKDTSDRTAYKVFEAGGVADLPGSATGLEGGSAGGFDSASNLVLLPDPTSFNPSAGDPLWALDWVQLVGRAKP